MAVFVLFIIFTMSLWCRSLSGKAGNNKSEICDYKNNGLKNGDKCTFDTQNFCNWTSAGTGTKWKLSNGEAYAGMRGTDQGDRAILSSPLSCEDNVTMICVQFDFKFDGTKGGRLSLLLCNFTLGCEVLWSANSKDNIPYRWYHVNKSASLIQRGRFQIQFQGKKTEDYTLKLETNFYLDNIVYENTSCISDSSVSSPTTTDFSTSGEKVTTNTYTDLPPSAKYDEDDRDESSNTEDEESSQLTMIAALIAVLMLTAAVVVVVVYFRRQRADADTGSKKSSISRDPRGSIAMVTNDLYDMTDGVPNTEEGILLQDLGTSPDAENYYSVVHDTGDNDEVKTQSNPDVVVHHGCDNYEIVDLDEDNVHWKHQQPTLGISSQS